ncbi:CRISPR-associated endonuclease Cas2 [Alicyclobacillus suci]|uniref:CRISPR-associated endonuclease Cas2 n=1 Tax=Alicyclobacillus suci TaxID=2816080 RepID=UPI0011BE1245|nr:CRISPR-associated endonuclease Cas2 [Alicyclobacillus suci]
MFHVPVRESAIYRISSRRRVAQLCVSRGQRVQKSVFECQLDELQYVEFIRSLRDLVHPTEDNVRVYRVRDFTHKHVLSLGKEVGIDFDEPLIL